MKKFEEAFADLDKIEIIKAGRYNQNNKENQIIFKRNWSVPPIEC